MSPDRCGSMKIIRWCLCLAFALASVAGATGPGQPQPVGVAGGFLIAPTMGLYAGSEPGLKGITDSVELVTRNGMNLLALSADWNVIEPAPGEFNFDDMLTKPLTVLVPQYPEIKGVLFTLRMISSMVRSMPTELEPLRFDDPEMLQRWDALLDAIAAEPTSRRLTHIMLGNEIDGYLGIHPEEEAQLRTFYKRGVQRIHEKLPGVKVGTIITFYGAFTDPALLQGLIDASDFVSYTLYTIIGEADRPWRMLPPSRAAGMLAQLAEVAGAKPFAFTEIGYATSPVNDSSADQQADFVREMFKALDPYRRQGRLEFLLYHAMHDYAPGVCEDYARLQRVSPILICDFMESMGLRSYATGAPRPAWFVFVEAARRWAAGQDLPPTWSQ
jgi:hypothetical protein